MVRGATEGGMEEDVAENEMSGYARADLPQVAAAYSRRGRRAGEALSAYLNYASINAAYLAVGRQAASVCRQSDYMLDDWIAYEAMSDCWNRMFDVASALHIVRMDILASDSDV